jgi:hypothetical protein
VLDNAHRIALRGIARGIATEGDAPAVRNLAVAGLIAPVDGAWTVTQSGHAVLELEGGEANAAEQANDFMGKVKAWFMT